MAIPSASLPAWQKAAFDASLAYAQAALASAEQLLKINLDTARNALEQNSRAAQELLAVTDPRQLSAMRAKLAQLSMQHSAAYAQNIYELVSNSQSQLAKLVEQQIARLNEDVVKGAETVGKNAPGSDAVLAAMKSSVAASSAMLESLNRAAKQFQEISEASMKAAAANMARSAGHK